MQSNAGKKAIIIGGGIGGVTAAIALQQAGFDVTVFERADELREVGSGLPLWTNALRALQKIGLNDVLEILGAPVTTASVSTWRGDILADLRTEELPALSHPSAIVRPIAAQIRRVHLLSRIGSHQPDGTGNMGMGKRLPGRHHPHE